MGFEMHCIEFDLLTIQRISTNMRLSEIGLQLQQARKTAGLSQTDLAAPLGMSRATVSALERGRCEEIGATKLGALLERVGLELTTAPRRMRPTLDQLRAERSARNAR
jgi:HTH-type transcriptional regulator / antitoxin HipB